MLTQRLGTSEVDERQGELGVRTTGRLHDDAGQPEQPGQDRAGQLDGLHPLEPHLAVLAEEHTRAQLDLAPRHPEAGEAPGDPVDAGDPGDEQHEGEQGEERVGDDLLEGAVLPSRPDPDVRPRQDAVQIDGAQEAVEELAGDVPDDRDEHDAAAQQGRQRVQPLPLLVPNDGLGHRPARCASPRADRRSRRASASATGRPGSDPPLSGEAVWISHEAMPWARINGPDWMSTYWRRP